jgi:NtrC-family two-component system response regulator AlgB
MTIAALRILIIDDEDNIRLTLSMCLEADGHEVVSHDNINDALTDAASRAFDLVFLDVRLGADDGLDFLPRIRSQSPWAKVVVITAYASVSTAVQAMKGGATDYLPKPFTPAQVRLVTDKIARQRRLEWKVEALRAALGELDPEADFPTVSSSMQSVLTVARQVADSRATILISGEVGTGKGRLARAIHAWSGRADAPFGVVRCQPVDPDALEAEVFGVGPQTPADACRELTGRVALCHGGTLVLEEVGQWPPSLQPKLLRLLSEREYERVNDFQPRPADVRIVAITSTDLREEVERGRFRPDLHLALDVVRIELPPLRERVEDIRLLAGRYLAFFCRENHRRLTGFTSSAMKALSRYGWPGNVRELRNIIERAVLLCRGDRIDLEHFPPNLLNSGQAYELGDLVSLETIEQVHVRQVLESAGSIKGAASILGINEKTLRTWLKRYPRLRADLEAEVPPLHLAEEPQDMPETQDVPDTGGVDEPS